MALDEAISVSVRSGASPTVLRLYAWNGSSVSLGAFQKICDINFDYCVRNNISVVRRPTGGRAILHGDDLTYSFSAKSKGIFSEGLMESYRKIGSAFSRCFEFAGLSCSMKTEQERGNRLVRSPLCFASSSLGEISSRGIKIIGSAQKRWTDGFLQQGSIPFTIDHERLHSVFGKSVSAYDRNSNYPILGGMRDLMPALDTAIFKEQIIAAFEETFSVTLADSQPSLQELGLARQLMRVKYQDSLWTRGVRAGDQSYNSGERPPQV